MLTPPAEGDAADTKRKAVQAGLDEALLEKRRRSSDPAKTLTANGFVVGEIIGHGAFSIVKKAYWTQGNSYVAIKIMSKATASQMMLEKYVPRELDIIRDVRHENIIRFLEVIETTMRYYIVMQYAEKGSFLRLLRTEGRVAEVRARNYFSQLLCAVQYLHNNGIAHRDIKCDNVTLDAEDRVKLIDFGFSSRLWAAGNDHSTVNVEARLSSTYCGSYAYASPEILQFKPYDPISADIWACGVVLYALLFAKLPFTNDKSSSTVLKSIAKGVQFPSKVTVSDDVKYLLKQIFMPVKQRLTLAQVRRSVWFYVELQDAPYPADGKSTAGKNESPAIDALDNKK
uniref:Protein kinase domain-containing protein n=1 Tax=Anopheles dirus TaxID=7168 RepID=A0A182NBB0_9DIPT